MENKTTTQLKEERLENLFKECQSTVINQMLSSFGLNQGMFTDRDGGNVTTLHNFELEDDQFVADRDKDSHKQANKEYDRSELELTSQEWQELSKREREKGINHYTGEDEKPENMDLDHISPLKNEHSRKKNHLAYNTGTEEGKDKLKKVVNQPANLATTDKTTNRSKGAKTNSEYIDGPKQKPGETLGQYNKRKEKHEETLKKQNIDKELMKKKQADAEKKINSDANKALAIKQVKEITQTGAKQAGSMALKQAIGAILTEFANIIFIEVKIMCENGLAFNEDNIQKLKGRISNRLKSLTTKLPSILKDSLKGGVSGFVSNLLVFIINNLISTAKRFVTIIREGLLGIYKAVKMILFPPKNMSTEEIWRTAIKLLSTTLISSIILSFQDVLKMFISGIPILIPIADAISMALVGILSGIASALVAYSIDSIIDKFCDRYDEKLIDSLMEDSKKRIEISSSLEKQLMTSLANININSQSIYNYNVITEQSIEMNNSYSQIDTNNSNIFMNNHDIANNIDNLHVEMNSLSETVDITDKKYNDLLKSQNNVINFKSETTISNIDIIDKTRLLIYENNRLITLNEEFSKSNAEVQDSLESFIKNNEDPINE